jgi:hypothetical protein
MKLPSCERVTHRYIYTDARKREEGSFKKQFTRHLY